MAAPSTESTTAGEMLRKSRRINTARVHSPFTVFGLLHCNSYLQKCTCDIHMGNLPASLSQRGISELVIISHDAQRHAKGQPSTELENRAKTGRSSMRKKQIMQDASVWSLCGRQRDLTPSFRQEYISLACLSFIFSASYWGSFLSLTRKQVFRCFHICENVQGWRDKNKRKSIFNFQLYLVTTINFNCNLLFEIKQRHLSQ